jgi:DNA transposition AAA+ family ATPase
VQLTSEFVATSVVRRLMARMQATHQRRRISVFAGPPGIGKTTAIDAFCARHPTEVAVVKIARRNAKEVLVLQHALEAVRQLADGRGLVVPSSIWELRNYVFRAVCEWANVDISDARRGEAPLAEVGHLTIIFDEAQNLSREALEVLRFWNDKDRCYSPFPIGLVFVGNNEFSLAADSHGASVISAAVADRALYVEALTYDDMTDDDLRMFMQAQGLSDPGALSAVMRSFRTPRAVRSIRRVMDLLDELNDVAGDEAITSETVREVMQLA